MDALQHSRQAQSQQSLVNLNRSFLEKECFQVSNHGA
jgi:hypothetical protein